MPLLRIRLVIEIRLFCSPIRKQAERLSTHHPVRRPNWITIQTQKQCDRLQILPRWVVLYHSLLAPMPILKGIRQAEVINWSIDPFFFGVWVYYQAWTRYTKRWRTNSSFRFRYNRRSSALVVSQHRLPRPNTRKKCIKHLFKRRP